jgi:glycosyltransferase involved in cell wall biosynthesis
MNSADGTLDLISVIVPCYNRGRLIGETLASIAAQSYSPIEVIVVDDGSSDDSAEVVKRWMDVNGPRHKHIIGFQYIWQRNTGPSAARNHGLDASKGQYIQFLDSDDILHREKLTKQVTAINQVGADFCVCNCQTFGECSGNAGTVFDFYNRPHAVDDFPAYYPMNTPAPLYRREVVLRNGPWDETLDAGEDFEFNFRIVARGARGVWLNDVLLDVRKHNGSERRQAAPLATRYQSMYLGLAKMEIEAIERRVCSPRLLNALGRRAYQYYCHTRAEGSLPQARVFLRYAGPRLFWTTKAAFLVRQMLPACVTGACVALKRRVRGKAG